MLRHVALMAEHYGDERQGLPRHPQAHRLVPEGFRRSRADLRGRLALVESTGELNDLLGQLELDQPWPTDGAEGPRGRAGSPKKVALPYGWLESRELQGSPPG